MDLGCGQVMRSESRPVPNGHIKPRTSMSINSCSPDLKEFALDSELTTVPEDPVSLHPCGPAQQHALLAPHSPL